MLVTPAAFAVGVVHVLLTGLVYILRRIFIRMVQYARSHNDGHFSMAHHQLESDSSPSRAETPPKLLVIDDDLSICTVIEKIGVKAGFVTSHAGSLEDAIRLVRTHQFDCITLDLNLRGDNGISLLRILANMVCTTPIVVISGSMPKLRDLAAKVGNMMRLNFLDPISKPIDFGKLRVTLAGVKQDLDRQKNACPGA